MPALRIEIEAKNRNEAKRIEALYQRGERDVSLDDAVTETTWGKGWTPVGPPTFVGLSNGEPVLYRFDVPVDTSVGR